MTRAVRRAGRTGALALLVLGGVQACQTAGMNPTGLHGTEVSCQEGARQTLDCRGAIQQYARDFRVDVATLTNAAGMGLVSTKLIEADAITSDLVQHYYQTCTLYNACLIGREAYVAKTQRLQEVQLSVRHALSAAGFGAQQNIQINPPTDAPGGAPPPPGSPGQPGVGPGQPGGFPRQPAGFPKPLRLSGGTPPPQGAPPQAAVDRILEILREGSKLVREPLPVTPVGAPGGPTGAPVGAVQPLLAGRPPQTDAAPGPPIEDDLDGALRTTLVSLKRGVVGQDPSLGAARVTVGNFTEEGQPWSSPLAAMLQEQIGRLVQTGAVFAPAPAVAVRGITVQQVAQVSDPNAPQALSKLYDSDLAIMGSYRAQGDSVRLRLVAIDPAGRELAQAATDLPRHAVPGSLTARPPNAEETAHLLSSLGGVAPRSTGAARVELTTSRPGSGASYRLGEEVRYFVRSTVDGYLYLLHVDAEKNVTRIFPNQHQPDARIRRDTAIEVPATGAPFRFEASPPFGLETTFAIVTPVPLDERAFQAMEGGFAKPRQGVAELVATRGIAVKPQGAQSSAPGGGTAEDVQLVWNAVIVLIRP